MKTRDLTELNASQKATIVRAACKLVQAAVAGASDEDGIATLGELANLPIDGVFVTVKRGETLRGCCGQQGQSLRLAQALADSATRTARDPRLPPLSLSELPYLNLSVSILGPLYPIGETGAAREDRVRIGTHGLRIQQGGAGGLLLPQVAVEQGWNARQFLDAVCRKAGLPAGAWQSDDAQVMLFDGVCFGGDFQLDAAFGRSATTQLSLRELGQLRDWAAGNLHALQRGATPVYYAAGVSDVEVLGLVLSVRHPVAGFRQWLQLSLRETRPLQSSLYQMTQHASHWLSGHPAEEAVVDVAILDDCVHHGSADHADTRGIDPGERAVILTDGRRWAVCGGSETTAVCIDEAERMEAFRGPIQLYSMHCQATADRLAVSIGPRGEDHFGTRPAAVAGMFYAANDAEREAEVDGLLRGLQPVEKRKAFAVMVPHAALRFSGHVAAEVWRRIKVPSRVLIIGPKHTPDGVDWAVAPHDHWRISETVSIHGDAQMARELAERIPGMQLDAAAHRREHGIEVQLPLMKRFCPDVRLAAIAMHGANVTELDAAAKTLADWIKQHEDPPLLVISSDMNHFAEDRENRRRDRLALDAFATGDGAKLLKVCGEENISMCGQIPAALVLMVNRHLGRDWRCEEIAYATSADCGGSPQRVVGYAGVVIE